MGPRQKPAEASHAMPPFDESATVNAGVSGFEQGQMAHEVSEGMLTGQHVREMLAGLVPRMSHDPIVAARIELIAGSIDSRNRIIRDTARGAIDATLEGRQASVKLAAESQRRKFWAVNGDNPLGESVTSGNYGAGRGIIYAAFSDAIAKELAGKATLYLDQDQKTAVKTSAVKAHAPAAAEENKVTTDSINHAFYTAPDKLAVEDESRAEMAEEVIDVTRARQDRSLLDNATWGIGALFELAQKPDSRQLRVGRRALSKVMGLPPEVDHEITWVRRVTQALQWAEETARAQVTGIDASVAASARHVLDKHGIAEGYELANQLQKDIKDLVEQGRQRLRTRLLTNDLAGSVAEAKRIVGEIKQQKQRVYDDFMRGNQWRARDTGSGSREREAKAGGGSDRAQAPRAPQAPTPVSSEQYAREQWASALQQAGGDPKKAYRTLAIKLHPDSAAEVPESVDREVAFRYATEHFAQRRPEQKLRAGAPKEGDFDYRPPKTD